MPTNNPECNQPCPFCRGTGKIIDDQYEDKCEPCKGTGLVSEWEFAEAIGDIDLMHKIAYPNCKFTFAHCHSKVDDFGNQKVVLPQ